MDGWGHVITHIKRNSGHSTGLFSEPSLWKGPVVPFVFGLSYVAWPHDKSVLYLNAVLWAATQSLLFITFRTLGISRHVVLLALCAWIAYLPNRILFQYYFAEPTIALLSGLLFALALATVYRQSVLLAGVSGAAAALLLLARAPFALVVAGLIPVLWINGGAQRAKLVAAYIVCAAAAFSPWPIRNYVETGEFIPFTTEGGMIVAQGTFLAGHGENFGILRTIPDWTRMEDGAKGKSPAEAYRYWQAIAKRQVIESPTLQLQLITRKVMLFWAYLYPHTWIPTPKTALIAGVSLGLALIGTILNRRVIWVQVAALWVGGLWLFHSLVHAELRYNFPVVPLLFLLAAIGANSIVAIVVERFGAGKSKHLEQSAAPHLRHICLGP